MLTFLFLVLFSTFGLFAQTFEDSTLYLTWIKDPSTTMTVQWLSRTNDRAVPTVMYHKISGSPWATVKGKKLSLFTINRIVYKLNQVELTNLSPSTLYGFKIGHELDSEENEFRFLTMPSDLSQPIRFIMGGDMMRSDVSFTKETSKQAALQNPLFAAIGGDIAYAGGGQLGKWITWIKAWRETMITAEKRLIPVIAAIGNHDLPGGYDQPPARARIFATLFPMPGAQIYNVLDFGNYLSIFLLDSGHANPVGGAQAKWLENALKVRENVPHRFPIYHVPAYPSNSSPDNKRCADVRHHWVPIFEKAGLRVAFENHDHTYKRTFALLKNKKDKNGVIYLGDGAWGVRNPSNGKRRFYINKLFSKRNFILVEVDKTSERFVGIDDDGETIDEFQLNIN